MTGNVRICAVCCGSICDRYIMRVEETSYHERCLLCAICGSRLAHTCFAKDSKLLCRIDYDRLYGKKCLGCSEKVEADELVMRALDTIFHVRCFICVVCGVRLQRGDQFVIKQGQLFCRLDYEKEVEMLQGFNGQGEFPCDDVVTSSRCHDGRRGPKRPRTILTTQQRRAFKASFEVSPKPCRKVRENLAKDTGLSVRIVQGSKRQHRLLTSDQKDTFCQYFSICPKPACKDREDLAQQTGLSPRTVQVWFQNQRAKMKKIQKKARQEGKCGESDSGDDKNKTMKSENSPTSRAFLNEDSDTNASTVPSSEVGGGQTHPDEPSMYLPIKEEVFDSEDSEFFKSSANSEFITQNRLIAKGYDNGAGGGATEFPYGRSAFQTFFPQTAHLMALNPIDRLYSMQNSYFCSEDSSLGGEQ